MRAETEEAFTKYANHRNLSVQKGFFARVKVTLNKIYGVENPRDYLSAPSLGRFILQTRFFLEVFEDVT